MSPSEHGALQDCTGCKPKKQTLFKELFFGVANEPGSVEFSAGNVEAREAVVRFWEAHLVRALAPSSPGIYPLTSHFSSPGTVNLHL